MQDNSKTIQTYEEHIDEYAADTPTTITGPFQTWTDKALSFIPRGGKVLELGSGLGRDASYIEAKGYDITATDAPKAFVEELSKRLKNVRQLNALTDQLDGKFHMVFANAVFLHFTTQEFQNVLKKIHDSLEAKGILAFSVKRGDGSEWTTAKVNAPRFFQYWQPEPLKQLLISSGFEIISVEGVQDMKGTQTPGKQKWLHVIAKKS